MNGLSYGLNNLGPDSTPYRDYEETWQKEAVPKAEHATEGLQHTLSDCNHGDNGAVDQVHSPRVQASKHTEPTHKLCLPDTCECDQDIVSQHQEFGRMHGLNSRGSPATMPFKLNARCHMQDEDAKEADAIDALLSAGDRAEPSGAPISGEHINKSHIP